MPPHTIQIGDVSVPNQVFLAPMAGITDCSFRAVCRSFGCGLTYSEMISIKSIVFGNPQVKILLDADPADRPYAVQLFGHEPEVFAEAIQRLEAFPFDIVDINMGCPVPKVVKNGEGCALMNDPPLAGRIIESATRASRKPVTVKIRKGFKSSGQANAVEMARVAQESGAAAIAVHGRTRDQYYAGNADWNIIAEVKQSVSIPVIGNGDLFAPEDATRMLRETGCDAVMIARGAMGNPWLIKQTLERLTMGTSSPAPDDGTKTQTALAHARRVIAHKGENAGIREMRAHLGWYVKGRPNATALRRLINTALTYAELEHILTNTL